MEADAERGEAGEAPIVEEGTEGVRMMTVHKAKGLEFPVVILADPTCPATRDKPSRHVDPERRLWLEPLCGCAPVELIGGRRGGAAARPGRSGAGCLCRNNPSARLLVVPVVGDEPIAGWLEVLDPAIYPPQEARRSSRSCDPGCPAFGEDSVLDRGPEGIAPPGGSVRPGLHPPMAGRPSVVWWDPAVLQLDVEEQASLRQQRILEADPDGAAAAASEENYARWKIARDDLARTGIAPLDFGADGDCACSR